MNDKKFEQHMEVYMEGVEVPKIVEYGINDLCTLYVHKEAFDNYKKWSNKMETEYKKIYMEWNLEIKVY